MTPKQAKDLLDVFATGQFVRMDQLTEARSVMAKENSKSTRKKVAANDDVSPKGSN